MRLCFAEEDDADFIRWTSNLLRTFLRERSVVLVRQGNRPDAMLAGIWREHPFPEGLPVILVSNESWRLFPPHAPLDRYKAVLGLYPPPARCTFIEYPYAAVHFDAPVEALYAVRHQALAFPKTGFCCFVTSNTAGELAARRVALFREIDAWRRVDSAGRVANNVGYLAPRGLPFLRWIARYRYMICLENTREPGYITEKPFQAWIAGTVPIYDGGCVDELVPDAIVNAAAGDVLAELQRLEAQPDRYEAKRRAPLYRSPPTLQSFERRFRSLVLEAR
jgi:hypothetical protein